MDHTKNILNHSYFSKVLNAITDGILITNGNGEVIWLNRACRNLANISNDEAVGRDIRDLEKQGFFFPSVTKLVLEKRTTVSTVQVPNTTQTQRFIASGYPIMDEQGEIDLIVAHARDITEIVRTSAQLEEMQALLKRYSEEIMKIKFERQEKMTGEYFVGKSQKYLSILKTVDRVATVESTVLITGETGTGKSVMASRIHQLSERANKPFIEINCGAIPESLIESELFGYVKGAFTGANKEGKSGLIKMADGGTLFLDEIGELPIQLQAKLLQFLQQKKFLPVGSTKYQMANVRVIAATNLDLMKEVDKKNFRLDLFYRLNVLPIGIPSLRERKEDILGLVQFNLGKYNKEYKRNCHFSPETLDCLENYSWPGNIRELENLIERLVIIAPEDEIRVRDLPFDMRSKKRAAFSIADFDRGDSLGKIMDSVEKEIISKVYEQCKTTRKTAEELGITQSSLMRRLKKYNLTK